MAKEIITIQRRWSWLAALNIKIDCDPTLPPRIKLGLALKVSHETGAVLTGADLTGADLTGADLTGAVLTGADLTGAKIARVFATACRSDGYTFYGFELAKGGYKISAGCQWSTDAAYRSHIQSDYPGRHRGYEQAAETTAILDSCLSG